MPIFNSTKFVIEKYLYFNNTHLYAQSGANPIMALWIYSFLHTFEYASSKAVFGAKPNTSFVSRGISDATGVLWFCCQITDGAQSPGEPT